MEKKGKRFSIKGAVLIAFCFLIIGVLTTAAFKITGTSEAQTFWKDHNDVSKTQQVQLAGTAQSSTLPNFVALAEKLSPSVVNISTIHVEKTTGRMMTPEFKGPFEDFFGNDFMEKFFGGQNAPGRERKSRSQGSGFVINNNGYILTNNHVIENATEIIVTFSENKKEYKAEVIGADKKLDIALIKIEANGNLPAVPLGDSDDLKIGEWVMAIGNPFGLGGSVTAGIISQKGRIIGAGPYDDFLQTDASINPGNSGGPLFDLSGEVIGINTAIVARAQGIGFAIPINIVKDVLLQLKDTGKITRGWIGVSIQTLTPELAKQFGLDSSEGALISSVTPGDPAEKAGIKPGDVIVEFNGKPIKELSDLPKTVASTRRGSKVKVKLIRDSKELTLTVKIAERKDNAKSVKGELKEAVAQDKLGINVAEITDKAAETFGIDPKTEGVVITDVKPDSPVASVGLRRADIIQEINRQKIKDLASYKKASSKLDVSRGVLLLIRRGKGSFYISIKIGQTK